MIEKLDQEIYNCYHLSDIQGLNQWDTISKNRKIEISSVTNSNLYMRDI